MGVQKWIPGTQTMDALKMLGFEGHQFQLDEFQLSPLPCDSSFAPAQPWTIQTAHESMESPDFTAKMPHHYNQNFPDKNLH